MKYSIMVSISTKPMNDIADSVNEFMNGFGFNEKLIISSEMKLGTITSPDKISQEKLNQLIGAIKDSFKKHESVFTLLDAWIKEE